MIAKGDVLQVRRVSMHWGVREALADLRDAVGLVSAVPIAIFLVGTPVAVAITLVLWAVRAARGAF